MDPESSNQVSREAQHPNIAKHENTQESGTKPKKRMPSLDDPYEHAPPKPDGDPWAILLKPEMETDKIQCDAWKEEVQTLLIFAGLFSAVVTAFVIESYKFLQPDPNDIIIGLLTQIANGPNVNSSSPLSTGSTTAAVNSFVPSSPSIRINVFWFISLILSLATVLVGTIALQWLREHQSYPGLSSKEILATLRMRSEALKAWYIPQIFTALPLLLQGALVLFLAGLIDFTLPLGTKQAISVAIVIALILLFFAVTTILPALQPLFLLSGWFCRDTVPSPCAFKSPQSQVFRTFSRFFLYCLSFGFSNLYLRDDPDEVYAGHFLSDTQIHLFPHIFTIWHRKSWPEFDLEWLSLRDAWHNRILDGDPYLYDHRRTWKHSFPLSDITQCLVKIAAGPTSMKYTEEFLVAACYCFQEVSTSIWVFDLESSPYHRRVDRRSNYLEQLQKPFLFPSPFAQSSFTNFLIHDGLYSFDRFYPYRRSNVDFRGEDVVDKYVKQHHSLFYWDQVCLFLNMLLRSHTSPALVCYKQEVQFRVMQYLLPLNLHPLTPLNSGRRPAIRDLKDAVNQEANALYWVDLLDAIVEHVLLDRHTQDQPMHHLYIYMTGLLKMEAQVMTGHLQSLKIQADQPTLDSNLHNKVATEYGSTFRSVAKHLNDEIRSSLETSPNSPSILFYHSAMILKLVLEELSIQDIRVGNNSSFGQGLAVLFDALTEYKRRTDDGPHLEGHHKKTINQFYFNAGDIRTKSGTYWGGIFSTEWWASLSYDYSYCYGIECDPIVVQILETGYIEWQEAMTYCI